MADLPDRFIAPPPIVIPKNATREEELRLRYGKTPPPVGSPDRADYDRLVSPQS